MTAEEDPWFVPEHLCSVSHTQILFPQQIRTLARVDDRLFASGLVGLKK
jgi:hypothetical protein